ncbi:MAG: hypothetical protein MUF72_10120 [Elainella sp. Prado103]|nr:hypothetical protein [Elainella sp. Prado103]
MTNKPWTIFTTVPNSISPQPIASYTQRACAEQACCSIRRKLPSTISVFVAWNTEGKTHD